MVEGSSCGAVMAEDGSSGAVVVEAGVEPGSASSAFEKAEGEKEKAFVHLE